MEQLDLFALSEEPSYASKKPPPKPVDNVIQLFPVAAELDQLHFSSTKLESDLVDLLENCIEIVERGDDDGWEIWVNVKLPRKLYDRFKKILSAVRGWWDSKSERHLCDHDPRPLIAQILESSCYPKINPHSFFPTPPDLINEFLDFMDFPTRRQGKELYTESYWKDLRIADLTAGSGNMLVEAHKRFPMATFEAVEIDPINRMVLSQHSWINLIGHDIFEAAEHLEGRYDWILFNPPFDGTNYVKFVNAALKCLRPGGKMLLITPPNFLFSSTKAVAELRSTISEGCSHWEEVSHDDFPVKVVISCYSKPDQREIDAMYNADAYGYQGWVVYHTMLYLDNEQEFDEFCSKEAKKLAEAGSADATHLYRTVASQCESLISDIIRRKHWVIVWNSVVKTRCVKRVLEKIEEYAQWIIDEQLELQQSDDDSLIECSAA